MWLQSDLLILPWWGNATEADLTNDAGEYFVEPPYELLCKHPIADSWGKKSLLIRGPIAVGGEAGLHYTAEFYQNLVVEGGDGVPLRGTYVSSESFNLPLFFGFYDISIARSR